MKKLKLDAEIVENDFDGCTIIVNVPYFCIADNEVKFIPHTVSYLSKWESEEIGRKLECAE